MTVLVAIPYWGVPADLVDRAVRHALAQDHADTVVLVTGDGQKPPVSVKSSRLVVGTLPANHGAPFTQQAMILGSPFEWYAPHGADDWIEPHHVSSLLRLRSKANGSGVIWYHGPKRVEVVRSSRTYVEFGVLDTALLRSIGGYNASEPCGQDSVVISLLFKTTMVRLSRTPTYHKQHREDSLTHHPDTRGGSPLRTGVRLRNREVLARCEGLRWRVGPVKAYREGLISTQLRSELEDSAALIARWLG